MEDMVTKGRQSRGECAASAKLCDVDVVSIRDRYAAGGISQRKIAMEFGVHNSVISRIVNHKIWAHLGHPSDDSN